MELFIAAGVGAVVDLAASVAKEIGAGSFVQPVEFKGKAGAKTGLLWTRILAAVSAAGSLAALGFALLRH